MIGPELAPRVAVTFSSAIGGLDAVLAADRRMIAEGKLPPPYANPNSCINMVGGKIAMLTGATGPITATITRLRHGRDLHDRRRHAARPGPGRCRHLRGGGFRAGRADRGRLRHDERRLPARPGQADDPPARASRPFSIDRRGFVVSEGAGCVILATPAFARAHGLAPAFEMAGWGMTSDAHHFVAPAPGDGGRVHGRMH